jgi:hypothetical protein
MLKDKRVIRSISELEGAIQETNYMFNAFNIYRGVSSYSYELKSSLLRYSGKNSSFEELINTEKILVEEFKKACAEGKKIRKKQNDVEWLMLAQHYKLPTRLLD